MKFSKDGSFLATGGQDGYLIIWKINRKQQEEEEEKEEKLNQETEIEEEKEEEFWIQEEPHKKFLNGKYGDVLDLDWSSVRKKTKTKNEKLKKNFCKNNFLVVSTMDKKVRVFHVTRDECLGVFPHSDIVTSVIFHPMVRKKEIFLSNQKIHRTKVYF